jgi:adenylosuccinate synthase
VGATKAHCTRVGTGPFPTEIEGEVADRLRGVRGELGAEFGTVTGRQRRMGWLDGVVLRYATRINSLSDLFLTKFDKLSGIGPLKIATAYLYEGDRYDDVPPHQSIFHKCEPVYEELDGWDEDISRARAFADLPFAAQRYVHRVEEIAGVPVTWISVGPEREQLVSTAAVPVGES